MNCANYEGGGDFVARPDRKAFEIAGLSCPDPVPAPTLWRARSGISDESPLDETVAGESEREIDEIGGEFDNEEEKWEFTRLLDDGATPLLDRRVRAELVSDEELLNNPREDWGGGCDCEIEFPSCPVDPGPAEFWIKTEGVKVGVLDDRVGIGDGAGDNPVILINDGDAAGDW